MKRLDYEPTQKSVLAYAQVLLGEVEQQLRGQDQAQADKRARLAKTQVNEEDTPEPPLLLSQRVKRLRQSRKPSPNLKQGMSLKSLKHAGSLSPRMGVDTARPVGSFTLRFGRELVDAMNAELPPI